MKECSTVEDESSIYRDEAIDGTEPSLGCRTGKQHHSGPEFPGLLRHLDGTKFGREYRVALGEGQPI